MAVVKNESQNVKQKSPRVKKQLNLLFSIDNLISKPIPSIARHNIESKKIYIANDSRNKFLSFECSKKGEETQEESQKVVH